MFAIWEPHRAVLRVFLCAQVLKNHIWYQVSNSGWLHDDKHLTHYTITSAPNFLRVRK